MEAYGNYVKICCQNRMVLAIDTLTHLQTLLQPQLFFRVGKSFIVSRNNISSYSGEQLQINNQRIPISKLQRNAFLQWMAASND